MSADVVRGLVVLHGRGGDAAGMRAHLAPSLVGPDVAVAAPEAPGNSWWPTSFLAPAAQMEPWVIRGLDAVDAAIAGLCLPRSAVAVAGFSQGGCLALEHAARRGAGLAAVVAFSGGLVGTSDEGAPQDALYGARDKAFDYGTDLSGLRAVITCHERDPHIPIRRARDSAAALRRLGATATLIAHPGAGHHWLPEGCTAARDVLRGQSAGHA